MKSNYFIIGSHTEKVRGVLFLDESTAEKEFMYQKEKVCAKISEALLGTDQLEPLVLVEFIETTNN